MLLAWIGFIALVTLLIALDLGVMSRRASPLSFSQSLIWSALWICVSLAFAAVIYDGYQHHRFGLGRAPDAVDNRVNNGSLAVGKYLSAYVLEKALSVDNLFVMAVVFRFLAVPPEQQHRVLFWGVFGAIVLRGIMIGIGVELVAHYYWVLYIFAAFLLFTGLRLLIVSEKPPDLARHPVLRIARKLLPITPNYDGKKLITIENGRRMLTPLALAMILIETGDVVFATDSVPAVFAVTADPLLVFTSNIFAVLGLRALYFALAGLLQKFHYLKYSLALILIVVAVKIVASHWLKQAIGESAPFYLIGMVAGILAAGITASVVLPAPKEPAAST